MYRRHFVRLTFVASSVVLLAAAFAAFAENGENRPGTGKLTNSEGVLETVEMVLPPEIAAQLRAKATSTVLSTGFESAWPVSPWSLYNGGSSDVSWGRTTYRKASGSYSIWCAAGGSQSPGAGGNVPANTQTWAIAGPFDLSSATTGSLNLDLWMSSEQNYDFFKWMVSFNGTNFSGYQTSGATSGFQSVSQDLTDFGSAGNATGRSQVWIAFIYQSDGTNNYEGAYVDNVNMTVDGGGGSNCGTYVLTADNENNQSTGTADGDWGYCLYNNDPKHPIEFRFDINETNVTSAQLLLLVNDVDQYTNPAKPEVDKVYMNNTYLGDLTGADEEDSTTLFTVPPSSLLIGSNWVTIQVNQYPGLASDDWCVTLKQAQLIINGGCEGTASCRSVSTNKASYSPGETVAVTYEVDTTLSSQQIRVESNLVNPSGGIIAGTERVYTTSSSANDPKTVNLSLPAGATAGTYTAQILVFDATTGQLESSCEDTFTVTGGGGCTVNCSASVPATATVGQTISLQGSASTSGCGSVEYFWFPENNVSTATVFDQSTTWVYDTPGTYEWVFVVIADNERCERSGTITVTGGGCGLDCSASVPATATVGQTVSLQGSAVALGCGQVEYFWFPENNVSTLTVFDQSTTWMYNTPGTYEWLFVVIADNERCERRGTITVTSGGGGGCDYSYWIPVASRAVGTNNSLWRTDVGIYNRGNSSATVELRLYVSGGPLVRSLTLNPRAQTNIRDVINWISSGLNSSGAIRICSNRPLEVTSRTYNQIAAGVVCFPSGTLGQALDGVILTDGIAVGGTGYLPALVENSAFRTNIGYTNMGTTNASITVQLYNGAGNLLHSYNVNLSPGQWRQATQPFRTLAGQTNLGAASAVVTVNSGTGLYIYGSVVDNITNDPTTVRIRR